MKNYNFKINEEIQVDNVRLTNFGTYNILSTKDAIQIAIDNNKDLILINESQNPPIAIIDNYNRYLYNIEKAEKQRKKNSIKSTIKEIQLSSEISSNDLNTKIKKGIEILSEGNKIKCVLKLKGRQKLAPQRGEITILKYTDGVMQYGIPESLPKLENGNWIVMIKPLKKK